MCALQCRRSNKGRVTGAVTARTPTGIQPSHDPELKTQAADDIHIYASTYMYMDIRRVRKCGPGQRGEAIRRAQLRFEQFQGAPVRLTLRCPPPIASCRPSPRELVGDWPMANGQGGGAAPRRWRPTRRCTGGVANPPARTTRRASAAVVAVAAVPHGGRGADDPGAAAAAASAPAAAVDTATARPTKRGRRCLRSVGGGRGHCRCPPRGGRRRQRPPFAGWVTRGGVSTGGDMKGLGRIREH